MSASAARPANSSGLSDSVPALFTGSEAAASAGGQVKDAPASRTAATTRRQRRVSMQQDETVMPVPSVQAGSSPAAATIAIPDRKSVVQGKGEDAVGQHARIKDRAATEH